MVSSVQADAISDEQLIDSLVDAYNARDVEKFSLLFAEDATIAVYQGAVLQQGRAQVREQYSKLFAIHPENNVSVLHRIVLAGRIIDHERISRGPSTTPFDVVTIYSIEQSHIARIDFVLAAPEKIWKK